MPPVIRRPPLSERIKAFLNPYDLLLWLAEELHESALDEALRGWTTPIGLAANLIFAVTRSKSTTTPDDDLFGDLEGSSGWFAWFLSFVAHFLAFASLFNAFYTFTRVRRYRLFENSIEQPPSTPSARRVRVDSSPSASPLSYLASALASNNVFSRRHPDQHNDVWEVSVWDPKPFNLELFALFSPGHVLVYWLFLPTTAADPRPSVTFVTTILLAALLSIQLLLFKRFFTQQAKDSALIHKEVMNEYDTKFVHPNMNRPVRDVGVQTRETGTSPARTRTREVDVYTPHTNINKGFRVNPNPSYASHLSDDPQAIYAASPSKSPSKTLPRSATTPSFGPSFNSYGTATSFGSNATSSFGATHEPTDVFNTPGKSRPLARDRPIMRPIGDGGSLGVYSHAASPLRKSSSRSLLRPDGRPLGSPLKKINNAEGLTERFAGLRDGSRRDTSRF